MINSKELKDVVFTIERLLQERTMVNEEIKKILDEAESKEMSKRIIRMLIKRRAMDRTELEEEDHLLEEYETLLR